MQYIPISKIDNYYHVQPLHDLKYQQTHLDDIHLNNNMKYYFLVGNRPKKLFPCFMLYSKHHNHYRCL